MQKNPQKSHDISAFPVPAGLTKRVTEKLLESALEDVQNDRFRQALIKARKAARISRDFRDTNGIQKAVNIIFDDIAPYIMDVSLRAIAFETVAVFAKGSSYEESEAINAWIQLLSATKREPFSLAFRIFIAWRAATSCEPHFPLCQSARKTLEKLHEEAEAVREERRQKNIDIGMFRLNAKPLRARRKFSGPECERYIRIVQRPEPI